MIIDDQHGSTHNCCLIVMLCMFCLYGAFLRYFKPSLFCVVLYTSLFFASTEVNIQVNLEGFGEDGLPILQVILYHETKDASGE